MRKKKWLPFISRSAAETKHIGRAVAKLLKVGDVVLFEANLGSGKTTMIQGMMKSFGVKEAALSPTFVMAQTLPGKVPVHHLDFYRMTPREIIGIGIQDYLLGNGEIGPGVVLIEWANVCREIWPKNYVRIRITINPRTTERFLSITAQGELNKRVAEKLQNEKTLQKYLPRH